MPRSGIIILIATGLHRAARSEELHEIVGPDLLSQYAGLGSPEFTSFVRQFPDAQSCLDAIEHAPVIIAQWQLEKLALVAQKAQVRFCTPGIPAEDQAYLWGPVHEEPKQAVEALCKDLPRGSTVAVIPDGPYVFSQLAVGQP